MKQNFDDRSQSKPKGKLSPAKTRRARNQQMIVELYLQGNTMERVVQLMEEKTLHRFSLSTVHEYVNKAIVEWQRQKAVYVDNHKALELEQINRLQATYWEAWERSKEAAITITKKKGKAGEGQKLVLIGEEENKEFVYGDPRFLKGVEKCIEMRMKLLGIDTPTVNIPVQVNNNVTNNTSKVEYIRKVVFKTRETTTKPQIIENSEGEQ